MNRADLQAALENPNVPAFLKALRLGEGTSDEDGYRRIVGGELFDDFSQHPNKRIYIERYKVWSTAAGAYQITHPTWLGLQGQYGFTDFEPATQDEAATALIIEKRTLEDLIAGDLLSAVKKCSMIWASLPGSKAGQRTEAYAAVQQIYLENGGVIS